MLCQLSGIICDIITTISVVMTTVPEKIAMNIGRICRGFIVCLKNLRWILLQKRMQTHRVDKMDYWKTNWPALVYVYSATVSKKVIWYIMILGKLETLIHRPDHHRHLHRMLSWLTQRVRVQRKDRSTKEWLRKVIFRVWQQDCPYVLRFVTRSI